MSRHRILCTRIVGYLLVGCTMASATCVKVKDKRNRDEEIDNTASSMGGYLLWEKLKNTKEKIDETYDLIHGLQDSLDKAKELVHTVTHLGMANLSEELLTVNDIKSDIEAYVSKVPNHPYAAGLNAMYNNPDVKQSATQLSGFLYYTDALPSDPDLLGRMTNERASLRSYFSEYADKRALQIARSYRKWSKLYREKGTDLSANVLEDKKLTMTDLERIETQRIARMYVVLSYEFLEKSDSILLAVQENSDPIKDESHNLLKQFLQLDEHFND